MLFFVFSSIPRSMEYSFQTIHHIRNYSMKSEVPPLDHNQHSWELYITPPKNAMHRLRIYPEYSGVWFLKRTMVNRETHGQIPPLLIIVWCWFSDIDQPNWISELDPRGTPRIGPKSSSKAFLGAFQREGCHIWWNMFQIILRIILVGGFNPAEHYESAGMIILNLHGKNKIHRPNHQPVLVLLVIARTS